MTRILIRPTPSLRGRTIHAVRELYAARVGKSVLARCTNPVAANTTRRSRKRTRVESSYPLAGRVKKVFFPEPYLADHDHPGNVKPRTRSFCLVPSETADGMAGTTRVLLPEGFRSSGRPILCTADNIKCTNVVQQLLRTKSGVDIGRTQRIPPPHLS